METRKQIEKKKSKLLKVETNESRPKRCKLQKKLKHKNDVVSEKARAENSTQTFKQFGYKI